MSQKWSYCYDCRWICCNRIHIKLIIQLTSKLTFELTLFRLFCSAICWIVESFRCIKYFHGSCKKYFVFLAWSELYLGLWGIDSVKGNIYSVSCSLFILTSTLKNCITLHNICLRERRGEWNGLGNKFFFCLAHWECKDGWFSTNRTSFHQAKGSVAYSNLMFTVSTNHVIFSIQFWPCYVRACWSEHINRRV